MPELSLRARGPACETERKRRTRHYVLCALVAMLCLGAPVFALAQPEAPPAQGAEAHEGEEAHEGSALALVARLFNFAVLAGTLVYLLRSPLAAYLADRGTQIRSDLVNAAELKVTAAAQIAEVDRKLKALPAELDALRAQGTAEIASEASRIRAVAATERDRLLDQARRDIDQQVKIAERELVNHAADLAVGVATERIRKSITDEDQTRLADRYVQQLKH